MKYFLGYDLGSSSVEAAPLEAESGKSLTSTFSPAYEMKNQSARPEFQGLDFNRHHKYHLAWAAQEGIVFSLPYGAEIMQAIGPPLNHIKAGYSNMFLCSLFSQNFASCSESPVEMCNTDGVLGAARGAHGNRIKK